MNAFDQIKENISLADILNNFGISANNKGFICCPFHKEKTPSLKIYEKSYYCFGCGASGTVIDFTKNYLNMDLPGTVKYLQKVFNLTDGKMTAREKLALYEKQQQRGKEEKYKEKINTLENYMIDYYRILWQAKLDGLGNPLYITALNELTKLDYYLDWIKEDSISFLELNQNWIDKNILKIKNILEMEAKNV